jgi:hypothetical protein
MNVRAKNFLKANEVSPVVYFSQDGNLVTFRLESGKVFNMTALEAQAVPAPKLAYRVLQQHRKEELALLAKVEAEACRMDCGERR